MRSLGMRAVYGWCFDLLSHISPPQIVSVEAAFFSVHSVLLFVGTNCPVEFSRYTIHRTQKYCMCVCVCVFIKLHITTQSGPVILVILCVCVCVWCVCVCVFFLFILDIKFVGRTSRGHTGGRSHRSSHPPSFCGACLNFSREKDSAIPFPRRP